MTNTNLSDFYPCKGCKKPVNNSSGICRDCRKVPCKHCGIKFSAKVLGSVFCGTCKSIRSAREAQLGPSV